jgi:hypothetical protein
MVKEKKAKAQPKPAATKAGLLKRGRKPKAASKPAAAEKADTSAPETIYEEALQFDRNCLAGYLSATKNVNE